jgi:hypothetical protein
MLVRQSPANPNAIREALLLHATPATTAIQAAVAYVTTAGAREFVDGLQARIGDRWPAVAKTIVTCFDFGHTDPDGLETLLANGFEVRVANLAADGSPRLDPHPSSFHPKIYILRSGDTCRTLTGSCNLSSLALTVNTEAAVLQQVDLDDATETFAFFETISVPLTRQMLYQYRNLRQDQKATRLRDETVVLHDPAPNELTTLRNAVGEGTVTPAEFTALWVEILGAQGAAENQLELPRGAQRFFGFDFDDYDDEQREIGTIRLTCGALEATRTLAWHGDNGMERINMPTLAQGGFVYAHRVVLFERRNAQSYEFTVEGLETDAFSSWLSASLSVDAVFRVGAASPRRCGLL